jgi:hypothetical protein
MMFKIGHVYSHTRMMDAAILVLSSYKFLNGNYSVRVRWVSKNGGDFAEVEDVVIVEKEVKNWYLV